MYLILLSGGMDSAACLLWAAERLSSDRIDAIFFDYGQVARREELLAAMRIWSTARVYNPQAKLHRFQRVNLPQSMFAGNASILGRSKIDQYETPEQAVSNTPHDKSQVPLRNAIFVTIAAHHLLAESPQGGSIIIGTRGRSATASAPGFPDCTRTFAGKLAAALSEGAGVDVDVLDFLNLRDHKREDTISMMLDMRGGREALAASVSCYHGTRCGKCLPCVRRKQAFEAVRVQDPAQGMDNAQRDLSDGQREPD